MNALLLCLPLLDAYNLTNSRFQIELRYVLSEFAGFYLGKVKKVLDKELHELCRRLLDAKPFLKCAKYL